MDTMPPVHFNMELPIPAIHRKPCFLWRQRASAIDFCQVLRKNDPSFKLMCPWICASFKIYRSSFFPELLPLLLTIALGCFVVRDIFYIRRFTEQNAKRKGILT